MSKVCSLADEKAHRGATTVWLNQNAVKLIGLFVGDNTDVTNLVFLLFQCIVGQIALLARTIEI